MRRSLLVVMASIAILALAVVAEDSPWFDLKKCEFCNKLAAQPGLIEHMNTEYHNLHNGTLSVTHIDKDFLPAFHKAQEAMRPVVQDLQAGKQVYTCPHCTTLGMLMMSGVIPDQVDRGESIIVVYTSSDSTMIAKIQDFGKKSAEALAAMTAKPKPAAAGGEK
jgi:hypothetical protein